MSPEARRRMLETLLQDEVQHDGLLPDPDYDTLGELSANWRENWEALVELGAVSSVLQSLLAGIREPAAMPWLASVAGDDGNDPAVRSAATIAIGRTGGSDAEQLLTALLEKGPGLRRVAARELGRLATPGAQVTLAIHLGDHDSGMQRAVAAALARRGDRGAVKVLLRLLRDDNDPIAGALLGELVVPAAVSDLQALLYRPEPLYRSLALAALAEIGDPRAVPQMLGALADEADEVRAHAVQSVEVVTGYEPWELTAIEEPAEFVNQSRAWWKLVRGWLRYRVCYWHGQPRSLAHWFNTLADVWHTSLRPSRLDALEARLSLATGRPMEFDAYSLDKRANDAALTRWTQWWDANGGHYPRGRWYWLGAPIEEPTVWE